MNGELDGLKEAIRGIEKRNDERHSDNTGLLGRILDQTTRTNGRVSALEIWKEGHDRSGQVRLQILDHLVDDMEIIKKRQEDSRVLTASDKGLSAGKRAVNGRIVVVLLVVVGPLVTAFISLLIRKLGW